MIKIISFFALFLYTYNVFSCCAEKHYRLFPIGELNNEIVLIEFDFHRKCNKYEGGGPKNEFWLLGNINLVKTDHDSIIMIDSIATINHKECVCIYKDYYEKTNYEQAFSRYYLEALNCAKAIKGFTLAKTQTVIFNDSTNTTVSSPHEKHEVKYRDSFTFDINWENVGSCYPSAVTEFRTYTTPNFNIQVIRLSCNYNKQTSNEKRSKKRFKRIKTAIWKEDASWHGLTEDYLFYERIE